MRPPPLPPPPAPTRSGASSTRGWGVVGGDTGAGVGRASGWGAVGERRATHHGTQRLRVRRGEQPSIVGHPRSRRSDRQEGVPPTEALLPPPSSGSSSSRPCCGGLSERRPGEGFGRGCRGSSGRCGRMAAAAVAAMARAGLRVGGEGALGGLPSGSAARALAGSSRRGRSGTPDPGHAIARREAPRAPVKQEAQWTRVRDRETGAVYWWNEATDQTTPVGVPKPTTDVYDDTSGQVGTPFTSHLGQMVVMGAGVAVAATMVRAAFSAF